MSFAQEHEQRWRDEDANKAGFGKAVFDRALSADRNTEHKIGLGNGSGMGGGFSTSRTAIDRRPARPVTRPNDGPAPDREARAAAMLAAIAKKDANRVPKNERRDFIMHALLAGAMTAKQLADHVGFSPSNISDITSIASKYGLVLKTRPQGNGAEAIISLTDEGRDYLAALDRGGEA